MTLRFSDCNSYTACSFFSIFVNTYFFLLCSIIYSFCKCSFFRICSYSYSLPFYSSNSRFLASSCSLRAMSYLSIFLSSIFFLFSSFLRCSSSITAISASFSKARYFCCSFNSYFCYFINLFFSSLLAIFYSNWDF
jgi:hypothetical protein